MSRQPPQTTKGKYLPFKHAPDSLTSIHSQDPEVAAKDFRARIKNYEKVYQTIDESEKALTYVKITNVGYEDHSWAVKQVWC
jgi:hypothetical protein